MLDEIRPTIISACFTQSVSTLLGVCAGWYTVQPPSPQKIVVRDVFPMVTGALSGAVVGFVLTLLIINQKVRELKDGRL